MLAEHKRMIGVLKPTRHCLSVWPRSNVRKAMGKKRRKKLHGTVQKVIKPIDPRDKEKAQIDIREADDLYREIRVENVLTDEDGDTVSLKPGAEVDVIVEADTDAINIKRKPKQSQEGDSSKQGRS